MNAIAQIQGVQDIITSKLPVKSLPVIAKSSSNWEKPGRNASLEALEVTLDRYREQVATRRKHMDGDSPWIDMVMRVRTYEGRQEWHLLTGGGGHISPKLIQNFITTNKQGGRKNFLKLKTEFLEQVELEQWKLSDPRRKHHKIPEDNPIQIIHRKGAEVFDCRIKIEDLKQEILDLLKYLYPEHMEEAGKKIADFEFATTPETLEKNLERILPRRYKKM